MTKVSAAKWVHDSTGATVALAPSFPEEGTCLRPTSKPRLPTSGCHCPGSEIRRAASALRAYQSCLGRTLPWRKDPRVCPGSLLSHCRQWGQSRQPVGRLPEA
eukprot:scaffold5034_cov385-Prasinococcus_capsulatus_cf.AAC.8